MNMLLNMNYIANKQNVEEQTMIKNCLTVMVNHKFCCPYSDLLQMFKSIRFPTRDLGTNRHLFGGASDKLFVIYTFHFAK